MRRTALLCAIVAGMILGAPAVAGAQGDGLEPGGLTDFDERVTVNVVFVGFDEDEAPWQRVRQQLLSRVEPVTISRLFYGITERLGLDYAYDYRPHYTSRAWEDSFFSYLSSLAVPKPLTEWQEEYNAQAGRLDVTNNHWIDAPTVEKRLIDTAPHGVDTRNPTIYFVNWFGRRDFKFHVYTKTGEPDPDTGYDFGLLRDTRKIVAWGGTTPDDEETGLGRRGVHRVWFYDLSAGPESWAGNFDVTNPDLDGDDVPDYRIPVSWEYGSYRPRSALAGDLGKVVRYVGVDMLFTASPVYPPYFNADRLPRDVDLDVEHGRGLARRRRLARVHQARPVPRRGARAARPASRSATTTRTWRSAGDLKRCFDGEFREPPFSCYREYQHYSPDANSFLWTAFNRGRILDRDADYEAALVNYSFTPDANTPLGYAADNWLDGTQAGSSASSRRASWRAATGSRRR